MLHIHIGALSHTNIHTYPYRCRYLLNVHSEGVRLSYIYMIYSVSPVFIAYLSKINTIVSIRKSYTINIKVTLFLLTEIYLYTIDSLKLYVNDDSISIWSREHPAVRFPSSSSVQWKHHELKPYIVMFLSNSFIIDKEDIYIWQIARRPKSRDWRLWIVIDIILYIYIYIYIYIVH